MQIAGIVFNSQRSPRCAGTANDEFRDFATSPIDRRERKLDLKGSDSAFPLVAYS